MSSAEENDPTKNDEPDAASTELADGAQPDGAPTDPPPPDDPLTAAREEAARLRDQLLRMAADFDNYRKRARKDAEEAERRGKEDVVREVLPVFDNLERAVQAASATSDVTAIVDGIRMVLRLFEDHAGRIGLSRLKTVGERFDPALHDAIQQVETDEHPPGTVMIEIVPGYRLAEKLVRPAMVVVARKPTATA